MPRDGSTHLTLSDLNICRNLFESLDVWVAVVTQEFELLWTNKASQELKEPSNNFKKKKCYMSLFQESSPCEGCPLLLPNELDPFSGSVLLKNVPFLVKALPLNGTSDVLVLHQNIKDLLGKNTLNTIIETLPYGLVLLDSTFHIRYVSPGFFQLFPFVTRSIEGKDLRLVISRFSPPFPKQLLDFIFTLPKSADTQTRDYKLEFPISYKNMNAFYEFSYLPFQAADSEPCDRNKRHLLVFTDRTQEIVSRAVEIQETLHTELDAILEKLYEKLSPLAKRIISLATDLSKEETGNKRKPSQQAILRESKNLLKILRDLKRYGSGKTTLSKPINLNTLIKGILKKLKPRLNDKINVKIKLDLTHHMKPIRVNTSKLQEVLNFVFENALQSVIKKSSQLEHHFTPVIEVQSRMHGTVVELIIKDNGIGWGGPASNDNENTDVSMCRLFIQSLGGEFVLRTVKNVGTKVEIKLPSFPLPPTRRGARPDFSTPKTKGKKSRKPRLVDMFRDIEIWLLGERDFATEMIQGFLKKNGATYQIVESTETFSALLREKPTPNALILNASDEETVVPFVLILKEKRLLLKTLFIIPSEFLPSFKRKFKDDESFKILQKPFPLESFIEALTHCLSERKVQYR